MRATTGSGLATDGFRHSVVIGAPLAAAGRRTGTILVADDDPDIRDLIAFKLTSLGHQVVAVADGAAALHETQRRDFDLAIFDVEMPHMTGLEALGAVRSSARAADLPVIMATAQSGADQVRAAFDLGANDYVTKPFSPRDLAARVDALLPR